MRDYALLLAGIACAGMGGELFVRGVVGLADWLRISPAIVGAVVAAFATSSPELSVAVNAALAGRPQIALGDILGSNIANVALVLALALTIAGIRCPRGSIRRDFPVALLIPPGIGLLLLDGTLSRIDGMVLLALFLAWLAVAVADARQQRSAASELPGERSRWRIVCCCGAGLALLILAGDLVVAGAGGIALSLGMDYFTVGVTVVAIATSTPELATAVIAKLRGHDEVGLGTILGSNIFNGLLIVPVAALISPITVADSAGAFISLCFGFLAMALTYPNRAGHIHRARGWILLLLYGCSLYLVLIFGG
ncbi:MAG: sodium:calcium antiporter [Desulfobulbus sp.]|jgi:cation:H+ antiporter|uniref:sodium:calcium antiporter n=1 Tax=Desulfobulbus sp. TaxID=895 RepID=UPI00284EA440|nr:sodium:calcium antiporter [Desulfobulbus sp.]MDR2549623.1 sodium:calcium antiporter [Desulfobulbus sp.]